MLILIKLVNKILPEILIKFHYIDEYNKKN
jgi:hypothetical protein